VEGIKRGLRWKVVNTGAADGEASPVRDEVRALLRNPPSCLYLYDGDALLY
jgi:hypothetical protein